MCLRGSLETEQQDAIAFLREENRVLKHGWDIVGCGWPTVNAAVSPFWGLGA